MEVRHPQAPCGSVIWLDHHGNRDHLISIEYANEHRNKGIEQKISNLNPFNVRDLSDLLSVPRKKC